LALSQYADGAAMSPVVGRPGVTLFVKLSGLVDFAAEIAKVCAMRRFRLSELCVSENKCNVQKAVTCAL
jgi:hypothetical protein